MISRSGVHQLFSRPYRSRKHIVLPVNRLRNPGDEAEISAVHVDVVGLRDGETNLEFPQKTGEVVYPLLWSRNHELLITAASALNDRLA